MLAFNLIRRGLTTCLPRMCLQSPLAYSFAFMALFERNKLKHELSPVFKRNTKQRGHLQNKTARVHSMKKNTHVRKQKFKLHNHKGLLGRLKIVGPSWNRQFKFLSPSNYHLKRHKSKANLKRKGLMRYVHKADIWRVRRLIPYFKRRSLKQKY